jgi:hypothetical protein
MKFKKVVPKESWSSEKTSIRIETTNQDIANFNRQMNYVREKES